MINLSHSLKVIDCYIMKMKPQKILISLFVLFLFILLAGISGVPTVKGTDIFNGQLVLSGQTNKYIKIKIYKNQMLSSVYPVNNMVIADKALSGLDRRMPQQYSSSGFMPAAPVMQSAGTQQKDDMDVFSFDKSDNEGDKEIVFGWLNQAVNNNEIDNQDRAEDSAVSRNSFMAKQGYSQSGVFQPSYQDSIYGAEQPSLLYDSKNSFLDNGNSFDDKEAGGKEDIFNKSEVFDSYRQNYNYDNNEQSQQRSPYDVSW